ncbi:MAG: transglycosylase SLT domain-containing protein, partial [Gemmatimonadota bacterium]
LADPELVTAAPDPAGLASLGELRAPATPADPILSTAASTDPFIRDRVAFWIELWGNDQPDLFTRYLDRMGRYVELVDEELERRGLPASLRYLPIVESGYLPSAVSRVGASGLWQIMTPTARGLGLSVSGIVDDRRDPVASTLAALDYMEELHAQFGCWLLTLAAYNAGPGRIRRLLEQHAEGLSLEGETRFLAIRPHLPAETRDFVPKFLAAAALAGDPEAFGFPASRSTPWLFDEVLVPDATSLDVVAFAAGVHEEEVLALNAHYVRGFTPAGETRTVRVPFGRAFEFERNFALIPPEERLTFVEHVVASGETFSHIAARYGVALSELTGMNASVNERRLRIGMTIVVPVGSRGGRVASPVATQIATNQGASGSVHTVSSGESFWTIARRYGISTPALAAANGRALGELIHIGDELRIP